MSGLLIFGKTGQVACELARRVPDAVFLDRAAADLGDPAACAAAIHQTASRMAVAGRPLRAVINAAAWTAVDKAESEEAAALLINGETPGAMARACADLGLAFVHISTDYVFDGSGTRPWHSDDPVAPLGAYGRSKLAGEQAVTAAGRATNGAKAGAYAILRTSWVFSAHGANFVKTMLRLGASRDQLNVVADQIGGPTPAADIASACLTIAEALAADPGKSGIYHFSGAPDVSWADFAREIFAQSGLMVAVEDIPSAAYPTPAARPGNSRMDCTTTEQVFGIRRPDWRAGLKEILQDLEAKK